MRDHSLIFQEVKIIRMPGFQPPGFSVQDLKPQVNIIYGPNGSGKTTLAKGMMALLWPEVLKDEPAVLKGRFRLNAGDWFAEQDRGKTQYQKNGSPSSPPPLPLAQERDRYYLALHQLLQKQTEDISLAEAIIKESMGGYRLGEAAETLGFKEKPARRGKSTQQAEKAVREWQERTIRLQEIQKEEEKLSRLNAELQEALQARAQREATKEIIDFLEAQEACYALERELEAFPETVGLVQGNELEELQRFKEAMKKSRDRIQKAQEKIFWAQKTIAAQKMSDSATAVGVLTSLKKSYEDLRSYEREREDLQTNLAGAQVQKEKAASLLGFSIPEEKREEVDDVAYGALSHFARKAEELAAGKEAFVQLKALLKIQEEPQEEGGAHEECMRKGQYFLESWLLSTGMRRNHYLFFLSILFLISLIGVLAVVFSPFSLLLLVLPLGLLFFWMGQEQEEKRERESFIRQFKRLQLAPPLAWEEEAVRSRLQELNAHLAERQLFQERKEFWQSQEGEYQKILRKEEELQTQRDDLISRYGLAPDTEEPALYFLTHCVSRWQEAQSMVLSLTAKWERKEEKYQQLLSCINHRLGEYGYAAAPNSAGVGENIADLKERRERFLEGRGEERGACQERDVEKERYREAEVDLENLFSPFGLTTREEEELMKICACKDDYQQVMRRLNRAQAVRDEKREQLKKQNLLSDGMLEEDRVTLQARERELSEKAKAYQPLYGTMKEIETRIEDAKKENRLERALAEKERALQGLEDVLNRDYEELTGHILVQSIQNMNTAQGRPEVFKRAQEILATITRGSYLLEVQGHHPPSFRAVETATGQGKGLEELSSATRVQLLLAVRMAFVEQEEQGIILPLYLDETLANTDDGRADVVIESIIQLTWEGRQVFYFTAQESEVAKWVSFLEGEEGLEYALIQLKSGLEGEGEFVIPEIEERVSPGETLPSAWGLTHGEYGQKLSLPGFHPHQGAGAVHLWYLIEEVEVLETLLQAGIQRWSQLKTLLQMQGERLFPGNGQGLSAQLFQQGRFLEEFIASWKVGRGRPVDGWVLKESGAVSPTFIQEVSSLVNRLAGDGEKLMAALYKGEIASFRTRKMEELELYLQEHGYIDPRPTLSLEEIRLQMLGCYDGPDLPLAGERINRLLHRLTTGNDSGAE